MALFNRIEIKELPVVVFCDREGNNVSIGRCCPRCGGRVIWAAEATCLTCARTDYPFIGERKRKWAKV